LGIIQMLAFLSLFFRYVLEVLAITDMIPRW